MLACSAHLEDAVKSSLVVAALAMQSIALADIRPEIAWSTNFTAISSSEFVSVVRFSDAEADMVYFAGPGTAISNFTDPMGEKYDAYPYTTILPSPDPVSPVDSGGGMFVAKMNYRTNELIFLSFVKTEPTHVDELVDMDFDENGNIYLVGNSYHLAEQSSALPRSAGFAGCRSLSASGVGWDGIIVKLNADATQILRSCFWGYSGDDKIHGIAVIADGEFVIVGETRSTDFFVNNEDQSSLKGSQDAFYGHFVNDGSLHIASYLGGSGEEALIDVTYTDSGRILASGASTSADFPTTTNAIRPTSYGNIESIIVELDVARTIDSAPPNVKYASYFGGSGNDSAQEIVEDGYRDIYIVGTSNSLDYPVVGTVANYPTTTVGLVVTKFDSALSQVKFSTFEGDPSMNFWSGESIAVSDEGDIVVTGQVDGTVSFPWHNGLLELNDPVYTGIDFSRDGYLLKWLNSTSGYSRDYATLLGGSGYAKSVDIRSPGVVVVGGYTSSNAFVDKTYWTVPESIMGDLGFGPFAMVITNDIGQRQLPTMGGGGSTGGGGQTTSGGGGGAVSPWSLVVLALLYSVFWLRRRIAHPTSFQTQRWHVL
jgi:hypothetical protein